MIIWLVIAFYVVMLIIMFWCYGGFDDISYWFVKRKKKKYCPISRKKCNKNCVFKLEDGYCIIAAQKLYELHNELNKGEDKE